MQQRRSNCTDYRYRGHMTPMSGGGSFYSSSLFATISCLLGSLTRRRSRYVQHTIDVGSESAVPVTFALDELYEALLLEKVQVALDSPRASREPPRQGLHAGPAEPGLVVGIIG